MSASLLLVLLLLLSLCDPVWSSGHNDNSNNSNNNIVVLTDHLALQVISPAIIRVFRCVHCSEKNISQALLQRSSLVVVSQQESIAETTFSVDKSENGNTQVTTGRLIVETVGAKGEQVLEFRDRPSNKVLVLEGRSLADTTDAGIFQVGQEWELATQEGEAIYGGGQFVNGELNYRSAPIQLKQFNTEAVVPFLLSSNHYGILWDQYGEGFLNAPQDTIALVHTNNTNTYTSSFVPPAQGDYWFSLSACPNKFGCPGAVSMQLNTTTTSSSTTSDYTWNCGYAIANMPNSIACRAKGLVQGQTYHVTVTTTGNTPPFLSYRNIATHNTLVIQTKASFVADYYFVGNTPPSSQDDDDDDTRTLDGVIANYRQLTGTAYLYDKWVYGFWQCKEHYHNQTELMAAATRFRNEHIPVDAFVQDWRYWGDLGWGPHWDHKIYPDPKGMIQQLHASNIHFMISDWSMFDPKTPEYKALHDAGAMLPDGSHFMDPWNPQTRDMFMEFADKAFFSIGADALWLDATEPEGSDQIGKQIHLGSGDEYANTYSLMVAKSIHDGLTASADNNNKRRVFSLTRSSFAGQQRYGATLWSGDTSGSWDSLRRQIAMSTNYQLSGIPYWSMDTGGFFRPPDQYTSLDYHHLLIRWFQFSVFTPIFRVHGSGTDTELWNFGATVQATIVDTAIRFRYRLLEYIYAGFHRVETEHYTMQRGLVLDFWQDSAVLDIPDQYMFGYSFLVAPIYSPDGSRTVYLPKLQEGGMWHCFFSGKQIAGGSTVPFTNMTMDHIPVFVRPSIVVLGPDGREHVNDHVGSDPFRLEVRVYGGANSKFVLFEDDGTSSDPNRPSTSVSFSWDESSSTLLVSDRTGTPFPGMPAKRSIDVVLVRPGIGIGIAPTSQPDASVVYDGSAIKVKLGTSATAE
ncbi:Alpha-xylosidase BoGH31A [Seminavis robusta]|uniref:Alpha-xylosidase BoGH31A n=1 Tax=Seminavis robusta TaxID=568900 RepID=A0A9N8DFJ0_9STRA|nr:Alpha-xylosidase BoGH31A [Seminavis robusta]|eukprot:Sro64_g036460.1 Alpha-xylosidase BoGH31A (911) ;mRNA; f:112685-115417